LSSLGKICLKSAGRISHKETKEKTLKQTLK
jgi:hypothetical protein